MAIGRWSLKITFPSGRQMILRYWRSCEIPYKMDMVNDVLCESFEYNAVHRAIGTACGSFTMTQVELEDMGCKVESVD